MFRDRKGMHDPIQVLLFFEDLLLERCRIQLALFVFKEVAMNKWQVMYEEATRSSWNTEVKDKFRYRNPCFFVS